MSTLSDLWDVSERRHADRVAVIGSSDRYTYAELGQRIRAAASRLRTQWGVRPGEVVALLAPNCAEFVVNYFATVKLGAVVQPVDERLTADETADLLCDSGAAVLIVHADLWHKAAGSRARLTRLRHVVGTDLRAVGSEPLEASADVVGPDDGSRAVVPPAIAELMYTSGTTGGPKAVMRSHANVLAAMRHAVLGFGYASDDVIAIVMPLSHSSALTSQMLPMLHLGGTLILEAGFDPARLIARIRDAGVSCLRGVPTMWRLLLASSGFSASELPSLRLLINSSASIDPQMYVEIKRRFSDVRVMNSYGLTEASTCTVLPDSMALMRPDSIGMPIEGVDMCIMSPEGQPCGPDEIGEICVRGAHVCAGYRGRSTDFRVVNEDGWLHSGDLGYRDSDGFYYVQGRLDDVINTGGHKVVASEVERCIRELAGVADVAVVGVPHRVLGEVLKAAVIADQTGSVVDARTVKRHCAGLMASHKVPLYVEVVSALPRNSLGKILRRQLREHSS